METEVAGSYQPVLVAVSYLVAVGISLTALDLTASLLTAKRGAREAWRAAIAVTFGFGVWCMHFVGMISFRLPFPTHHDPLLVGVSLVLPIAACALALRFPSKGETTVPVLVATGTVVGAAIAGMHYTGMAAMRLPATITYDPLWVAGSILIAVGASIAAVWIAFRLSDPEYVGRWVPRVTAAAVLGVAITGMHYTGMAAAHFTPYAGLTLTEPVWTNSVLWLAFAVGIAALAVAVLSQVLSPVLLSEARRSIGKISLVTVAVVALVVTASMIGLYRVALNQTFIHQASLVEAQARLIEAVARFDAEFSGQDVAGGATEATMSQVRDAMARLASTADTEEFTMARLENDRIVWLLEDRPSVSFSESILAEPMRRALAGETGAMRGLDYRGETVIAAYEPVSVLDVGIVAKIDLEQVQAPFVRTASLLALLALVLSGFALWRFLRIGAPMIAGLEEREFLNALLATAPTSIVIENPDQTVLRVNRAFEETFGYSNDEVMGRKLRDVITPQTSIEEADAFNRQVEEGQGLTEIQLRRKDGQLLWMRVSSSPSKGIAEGSRIVIAEDITMVRTEQEARIAAQREYEDLVEKSADIVWRLDREGRWTFVNSAVRDALGVDPEKLIGTHFSGALSEKQATKAEPPTMRLRRPR